MNVSEKLAEFVGIYNGVPNTGDTPGNKGQCVGLIEVWLDYNHRPHIAGNAKDLPANADPAVYTVVKNSPFNNPPPGAIVCWNETWGAGFGHCAVVIAASNLHIVCFEQNNPDGAPPSLAVHGYNGVEGWIILP